MRATAASTIPLFSFSGAGILPDDEPSTQREQARRLLHLAYSHFSTNNAGKSQLNYAKFASF
jgi:hypothetical protein